MKETTTIINCQITIIEKGENVITDWETEIKERLNADDVRITQCKVFERE